MRKLFKALAKSLRKVFRALMLIGANGVAFFAGFVSSMLDGGGPDGGDEVVMEEADEAPAPAVAQPQARSSMAQLAKNCLLALDANRKLDTVLDMDDGSHVLLADWMESLDGRERMTLRNTPMPALARHLEIGSVWRSAGLPLYPLRVHVPTKENAPAGAEALSLEDRIARQEAGNVVALKR